MIAMFIVSVTVDQVTCFESSTRDESVRVNTNVPTYEEREEAIPLGSLKLCARSKRIAIAMEVRG